MFACYTQYQTYGRLSKPTKIYRNILSLPKSSVILDRSPNFPVSCLPPPHGISADVSCMKHCAFAGQDHADERHVRRAARSYLFDDLTNIGHTIT